VFCVGVLVFVDFSKDSVMSGIGYLSDFECNLSFAGMAHKMYSKISVIYI
jgi:hypothetical protein